MRKLKNYICPSVLVQKAMARIEHLNNICHTTFNCSTQKKYVKCLRGMKLCDGVRDCVDNSDEELYCKSKCSENEMICEGTRKCLPLEFKCNGDFDCEGGDDEEFCENRCVGGSKWCAVSKKCIPSWQICNGIDECGDGSDEEQCDCQLCSGSNKALCAITKKCITREKICDRNEDCHYGEDELQCPGGCFEVLVKQHEEMIECADKKKYVKKYACSGMLDQCKHFCEECDKELAFRCGNGLCIPRNKFINIYLIYLIVCDGNNDCNDHSDEMKCGCSDIKSLNETATFFFCNVSAKGVRKCISISQRCDGYLDCEDGADEINCNECTTNSNAIYCNLTRTCLASIKRCDGVQDCPNDIDEFECSCKECNIHANPMYYCSDSARCYRHNKICNPFSTCPYPQDSDRQYCAYKDRIL
ncbi:unnamed protein product [Dracunculus medinensis]|uniref:Low-density lipoprotein receptor-related protein 2 n=1 Tax=Dracunculus medinensis TaxID=318479 RepID=A0A0N4U9C3_DRAME|nr:unnamed protein product [Dracunculus medinensis]